MEISKKVQVTECRICGGFYRPDRMQEHLNLHVSPHQLVPKTLPNNLRKLAVGYRIPLDDTTEDSDIAIRSILPDHIPQAERQLKQCRSPSFSQDGSPLTIIIGENKVKTDQLDLQTNIGECHMEKDQLSALSIERVVKLGGMRTIPNKQINKYKNGMAEREVKDAGKQDRKVLAHSKTTVDLKAEPIYQVREEIQKKNKDTKSTVTVGLSFSRPATQVFKAIDTKSNPQPPSTRIYTPSSSMDYVVPRQSKLNSFPLHPKECPSCHGFFCQTCNSNIPPSYRPFWSYNQSPQLIAYYKSLQEQALKRQCKQCS